MVSLAIAAAAFFLALGLAELLTPPRWPAGCGSLADPGADLPGGSGAPARARCRAVVDAESPETA